MRKTKRIAGTDCHALTRRGGVMSGLGATGADYKPPSALGIAALLLNALRRTVVGKLGLAPKYQL